ncbi:hypothetical protein TgHK011_006820 [Trichoderma gracile]|nr:hypothetical protein TgHK011_006820 [Trichoderma gracile]
MLVGDLVHFRAALSNGVSHDLILSPSTTPATSRRNSTNTPDNRSIASQEDSSSHKKQHGKAKKRHWWSRPAPAVKAANCGAGMKLPMNVV